MALWLFLSVRLGLKLRHDCLRRRPPILLFGESYVQGREKEKKDRKSRHDDNPLTKASIAESHCREFLDKIARRGDAQISGKPRKKMHGTPGR